MRTEEYFRDGRRQWRYYCDTCKALIGNTAPGESHLPRSNELQNICPICGKEITKKNPISNQEENPVK